MRISIIIPVYNVYPYLEKCLNSVLNQTYPDLEIIIINDCSSDGTHSICEDFSNRYSNIKYYKLDKNRGISYARNFGIDKATGSLIGFVDGDDWIDEDMYDELYRTMKTYNASIVTSGYKKHFCKQSNLHGNLEDFNSIEIEFTDNNYFIENTVESLYYCLSKSDFMVWNKLYARKLFENIKFPVGRIFEDSYIMHLLVEEAGCIAVSKNKFYNYIVRPESTTTKKMSISEFDRIYACIERYEYLIPKYKSDKLEKICRAYIFGTLCDIIDRFVKEETILEDKVRNSLYKELELIYHNVFSKYSYEDCGLTENEVNVMKLLKSGIRHYMFVKKVSKEFNWKS